MTTPTNPRVWFVTGASGGLGRATVRAAIEAGDRVLATVRNSAAASDLTQLGGGQVIAVQADVTDPGAVRAAVARAQTEFGGINVLVNNAGYSLLAAAEEASDEQIRQQFETNVFGFVDVARAVIPVMRASGGGHMFMISSVAGISASAGFAYYGASKHAVEGFSEALSKELAPQGIKVIIVEPGLFRTNALGSSLTSADTLPVYADTVGKFRSVVGGIAGNQTGDPEELGRLLVRMLDESEPPTRLAVDPGASPTIRAKLEGQLRELDEWAARAATTPIGAGE
jgi:NAD(P)-dependent dehydrogenase (short-subunit alcohol dehydrogenase family)